MEAFDANRLVAELLTNPEAEGALAELGRLALSSPAEGAALLERLAAATGRPEVGSRWLTEAAALWSGAAGDPKRAARALRAAIELSPGDDRALARLTQLYRDNGKHRALARILERRAEALASPTSPDPEAAHRAAMAFTTLGDLLRDEPLNQPVEALAAYTRAIAGGAALPEAFRAARALYLQAGQVEDVLPLFALEAARTVDLQALVALRREEAGVRALAGDRSGASAALRLAWRVEPMAEGLAPELAASILERLTTGPVPADECVEAAELFVSVAQASGAPTAWRAAETCFAGADRFEDAAWAAEQRAAYPEALELLARVALPAPEDRLRVALRRIRLLKVGLGDPAAAGAGYASLLGQLPPACDAALLERAVRGARGGVGSTADVASGLETAALEARDLRALKLAFEVSARALEELPRAGELVRQTEVLLSLGAERRLALQHAEAGLRGLTSVDAARLLDRLARLGTPDEAVDVYERNVARCATDDERERAVELAAKVAVERASPERLRQFYEATSARHSGERVLGILESTAAEGDRARGGVSLRGALAAAFARAEPVARDGGRTRSALLRRASKLARRDLGDPDLAFEWLGDALFARLEAVLDESLAPARGHGEEPRRADVAARELRGLSEDLARGWAAEAPASRPPGAPAPSLHPVAPANPTFGAPPPVQPLQPPRAAGALHPTPAASSVAPAPRAQAPPAPSVVPAPARRAQAPPARRPAPAPPSALAAPAPSMPGPPRGRRASGEELLTDLFEEMPALDFCRDALEGADFTLRLAMEKLGTPVGLVHLYDIDRREFVVVRAAGPGTAALKGLRTSDSEPLITEVLRLPEALILDDPENDSRASGKRWEAVRAATAPPGAIASIASARLAQAGRFLGLLEVANLVGGGAFVEGDEHALGYIAEHLTKFVAERGVLLGDDA